MALLILGLGNDLLGDDAIGLVAAERIAGRFGADVSVRTTSRSGLYLLESFEGFDDAILVDSVLGDRPGRVRELDARAVLPVPVPSAHFAGLPEALALARAAGVHTPRRLRIFAVEVASSQTIGASPSGSVLEALPEVLRRVEEAAREWGYG